MTKEEVLQKVNEYCNEKSYTNETLTDDFKDKFSDFFSKKYPEETTFDAEGVLDDLKFNINTAFSATSKGITTKVNAFATKENEYKRQIQELKNRLGDKQEPIGGHEPQVNELPADVIAQLKEFEQFKNEAKMKEKHKEIVSLAKKGIREDLHKSFEKFAQDFTIDANEESGEQAKKLTSRFQDVFRDTIGDIKPLAPQVTRKRDEEFLESIPKITI
jgi:hypothetical protein